MAEDNIITRLMVEHHGKLSNMLEEQDGSYEKFDRFKWELEKHLFMEEKAIFIYWDPDDPKDKAVVPDLIDEHSKILKLMKELERETKRDQNIDIGELKALLLKHRDFEDAEFYPRLDRELDQGQKKIIKDRIGTMV